MRHQAFRLPTRRPMVTGADKCLSAVALAMVSLGCELWGIPFFNELLPCLPPPFRSRQPGRTDPPLGYFLLLYKRRAFCVRLEFGGPS